MYYKKTLSYILTTILFINNTNISFGFSDIDTYKYKKAIEYLKNNNIVQGYNDGTYQPNKNINRAEFLKIILESNKFVINTIQFRNCFPDVGIEWYAKYVCFAKEMGIVQGYNDGMFKPERNINYVEALKIAYESNDDKGKQNTKDRFWYSKYLEDAKDRGISLDELSTDSIITRGEMAELMYRLLTKKWNIKKGTIDIQLNTFVPKTKIKIIKGKVYIKDKEEDKDFKEINTDTEIQIGNVIQTDQNAIAIIYWPDDSITRLNSNTTIIIKNIYVNNDDVTDTQIENELLNGELWTKSLNLINGKSKIEIKSNNVIAGIRGSSFNIKKNNNQLTASSIEHSMYVKTQYEEKQIFENDEAIVDTNDPQLKIKIQPININEKDSNWWNLNKEEDNKFIKELKNDFNQRIQELDQNNLLKNYYKETADITNTNNNEKNSEKKEKQKQLKNIGKFLLKYKDVNILEQDNVSQKKVKDNLLKIIDDTQEKSQMQDIINKQNFWNNFDNTKDIIKEDINKSNNFIEEIKNQFYTNPNDINKLNNILQSDEILNNTEMFKKIKQKINEMEEKIRSLENQIKTLQK